MDEINNFLIQFTTFDIEIDGVVAAIAYGDYKIHVSGSLRRKSSLP